jgi:hypothetical protein
VAREKISLDAGDIKPLLVMLSPRNTTRCTSSGKFATAGVAPAKAVGAQNKSADKCAVRAGSKAGSARRKFFI